MWADSFYCLIGSESSPNDDVTLVPNKGSNLNYSWCSVGCCATSPVSSTTHLSRGRSTRGSAAPHPETNSTSCFRRLVSDRHLHQQQTSALALCKPSGLPSRTRSCSARSGDSRPALTVAMQTDFSDLLTLATAADAFAWSPLQREAEMPTLQREAPYGAPLAPSVAPTPLRTGAITPGSSLNAPAPPPAQSEAYRSPHGETAAAPHHTLLENAARVIESLTGRKARRPGTSCSRSSRDKSLRLWDLCAPNCQGVMHLTGRPVGKFDPEGLIFAVRLYLEPVELYDLRAFDRGPLNTFKLPRDKECDSERGGHPPHRRLPAGRRTAVCTCGAQRRAWGGLRTVVLNCDHTDPVHCYQFSPKYVMLVAACWTIWATTWPNRRYWTDFERRVQSSGTSP
ncbi:hypothetical protein HPB47_025607 [Ixodes persulcatus]|uniref:Uncharacterized protein n=2 Tax=Ixodes persulcatus TaxID=34615 RepID=A0AC60Q2W2_IXOPE|nr:hypothetical protein HPB47_025607 [Ixodes persulcatus]